MKKIVGIIAAVAMAASVFAVDFSGALKVQPNLFKINANTGAFSALADNGLQNGGMYYNTRFQVAVYADKAGAQFAMEPGDPSPSKWTSGNIGGTGNFTDWAVWIQPIDQLKIQFGYARASLFECFRDASWGKSFSSYNYGDGYKIDVNIEGFSATVILKNAWITNAGVGDTLGYLKYSIDDVGTFGVAALYQGKALKLVAGYGNVFGDIDMFVQGGVTVVPAVADVFAEFQLKATLDTVSIPLFVRFGNTLAGGDFIATSELAVYFKPTITLDSAKIYIDVIGDNVLASQFSMTIQPGVEFNIGAASCDLGVKIDIGAATEISVPFAVTVGI